MKNQPKRNTIREKLINVNLYQSTIPMIVLAIVLMLIITVFSITQIVKRSNDIMFSIETASERDLNQYDNKLDEIYEVIIENASGKSIDAMLDAYVNANKEIMSLLVLDERGVAIAGAPENIINMGHDYSGHGYFKALNETGDVYWSEIFIVHGSNIPMISISKHYDHMTVVLQVDLEALTDFLKTFDISPNSYIAITDQSGTYLAHSDYNFVITRAYDDNRIKLLENEPQYVAYNDKHMLAFHKQLSENNWSIIFYQSILDMMTPLLTIIFVGILAIVVIGTRVIKFVLKLNNQLSKEVNELVSWSDKVAKGQYDVALKESSIKEFNDLYDAFATMTQSLLSREELLEKHRKKIVEINKGLELEVKSRTADLEASLDHLKQTQNELIQREKMASLGRLVSGVAHELNTPIGVALTAITYMEQKNEYYAHKLIANKMSAKDLGHYMGLIQDSSEIIFRNMNRASDLISSFKKVAVDQEKMLVEQTDIKDVIEATVTSLGVEIKKKSVRIHLDFKGLMMCESYPGAISQVITNLIQNSLLHAFDFVDDPMIGISCKEHKNHLSIKYWDNGKGIDEGDLNKIYEPFYTTALGSGGTGLGMNIVFNLVTGSLGGQINYHKEKDTGVVFSMILPKKINKNDSSTI